MINIWEYIHFIDQVVSVKLYCFLKWNTCVSCHAGSCLVSDHIYLITNDNRPSIWLMYVCDRKTLLGVHWLRKNIFLCRFSQIILHTPVCHPDIFSYVFQYFQRTYLVLSWYFLSLLLVFLHYSFITFYSSFLAISWPFPSSSLVLSWYIPYSFSNLSQCFLLN